LVLGAGGVFGAYQAGVWKGLADSFQPDLVVGASIGSINAWLIAGGCAPEELESLWLEAGPLLKVRARIPRRWTQGCFDLSGIEPRLAEIFDRYTPQSEYAAVVTNLVRWRPQYFTAGEMTWRHLLASCAVPVAFDLPRLNGTVYTDGGLLGALPLWAAVELGATRIVAVQPLPPPPFLLGLAVSSGRKLAGFRNPTFENVEVVQIAPERPLGSYFEMLRYRRDRVEQWIGQGERDAIRVKQLVVKCFERAGSSNVRNGGHYNRTAPRRVAG